MTVRNEAAGSQRRIIAADCVVKGVRAGGGCVGTVVLIRGVSSMTCAVRRTSTVHIASFLIITVSNALASRVIHVV